MRRGSILAALALLALVAVPIADAVGTAKPSMTVEGNVISVYDPDSSVTGMSRFEIRTTDTGTIEFGYYESQMLTGPLASGLHSQATVKSIRFFTAPTGGKAAEFTGTECGPSDLTDATSPWKCNPKYLVQVTDNAGRGVPDTMCGGLVGQGCLYPYTVTSGDIRIFSQQQR